MREYIARVITVIDDVKGITILTNDDIREDTPPNISARLISRRVEFRENRDLGTFMSAFMK